MMNMIAYFRRIKKVLAELSQLVFLLVNDSLVAFAHDHMPK